MNPEDGNALSQAMLDAYRDAAPGASHSARSLARAAEFSWDRCVRRTLDAYRMATAGSRGETYHGAGPTTNH